MTAEQFRLYQEQSFDAFCKKVIRNEAIHIHKRLMALAEKEIPLSALTVSDISALCYEDVYRPYQKTYYVQGRPIRIYDPILGVTGDGSVIRVILLPLSGLSRHIASPFFCHNRTALYQHTEPSPVLLTVLSSMPVVRLYCFLVLMLPAVLYSHSHSRSFTLPGYFTVSADSGYFGKLKQTPLANNTNKKRKRIQL